MPLTLAVLVALAQPPAENTAVNARIKKFVESGDIAGAVTVVGTPIGVPHLGAVGYRDLKAIDLMPRDALFRIASMTKPVTAVGIMILADRGKLSPADPVEK